jgi:immunity protein, SdpI family
MSRWFPVAILLTVAAFAGSYYVHDYRYDDLADRVPIHWNIQGEADGFVPKSDAFLAFYLMPTVMAGFLVLTLALPWLSPKHFEVDRSRSLYGFVMLLAVALLGFLHAVMLGSALDPHLPHGRLLVGGLCLFFALMGAVLSKVPRNFYIGVRTPWTLASEEVWQHTHRLAGWLFVAGGLIGLVAALISLPLWVAFAGIMVAALVPVLYSLVFYKMLEHQGRI